MFKEESFLKNSLWMVFIDIISRVFYSILHGTKLLQDRRYAIVKANNKPNVGVGTSHL